MQNRGVLRVTNAYGVDYNLMRTHGSNRITTRHKRLRFIKDDLFRAKRAKK